MSIFSGGGYSLLKKKGFSLIELLAVVIILAILALITIPIVGNLIKQARINAAVVSAYGYVEATNNELISKNTKGEFVENTLYTITDFLVDSDNLVVRYEGRGPDKGWFNLEKDRVVRGDFCINGYEVCYENYKATYVPDGEYCKPPEEYRDTTCKLESDIDNDDYYNNTDEFYIKTAEDLYCFAEVVNSGKRNFAGKSVILVNDINMTDTSSFKENSKFLNNNSPVAFESIGNSTNNFRGTFKGLYNSDKNSETHMYSISNLTINKSNTNDVGLFGYLPSGASVGEFNLINSTISGKENIGGVVGYNNGGTVFAMNLSNVSVTSNDYKAGGVVGYNLGTINRIVSRVIVSARQYAGGITGANGKDGTTGYIYNAYVSDSAISGSTSGGITGVSGYYGSNTVMYGVVNHTTITGSSAGKVSGGYGNYTGIVYTSSDTTRSGSSNTENNGQNYNINMKYIAMYDDVLDTVYGGAIGNCFFDFDSNDRYVLKKVDEHSFDTQISGSGTEADPYILSTERDFKDAATLLSAGHYYFKIADNIDVSTFNHFYSLGTYNNPFNGHIDGNNKTITNMNMNGGRYSGFIGYLNGGSISNLRITNSTLINRYYDEGETGILIGYDAGTVSNLLDFEGITVTGGDDTGGLIGTLTSGKTIGEFNINTVTVTGKENIGGVVGYNNGGTVFAMNLSNVSVTSNDYKAGGVVGYNLGTISEVTVNTGTLSANHYPGGIAGANGQSGTTGYIKNVYVNGLTISGNMPGGIAGVTGYYGSNTVIYGVVTNSSITGSNAGKVSGGRGDIGGVAYTSSSTTRSGSSNSERNGTDYSSDYDGDLSYYGSIKYTLNNVQYPLLDSRYTGDVNNTGWWFNYDSNGDIIVVRVTIVPSPIGGDPVETNNGTCPEGITDNTPPTCEFYGMSPITNGIMAQFSCTDDQGAPNIYSMFNSEYNGTYTAAEIIARTGTQKTGSVSGNTRNVITKWLTSYEGNKPERGRCYYYQYTAVDQCGNSNAYVTSYCEYGFSNPE